MGWRGWGLLVWCSNIVNCIRLGVGFKQTSYWFYIQQARAQTDDIQQTDDRIMFIAESHAQPGVEKMSIIRELFICSGGSRVGDDVVDNFPLFLSCKCTWHVLLDGCDGVRMSLCDLINMWRDWNLKDQVLHFHSVCHMAKSLCKLSNLMVDINMGTFALGRLHLSTASWVPSSATRRWWMEWHWSLRWQGLVVLGAKREAQWGIRWWGGECSWHWVCSRDDQSRSRMNCGVEFAFNPTWWTYCNIVKWCSRWWDMIAHHLGHGIDLHHVIRDMEFVDEWRCCGEGWRCIWMGGMCIGGSWGGCESRHNEMLHSGRVHGKTVFLVLLLIVFNGNGRLRNAGVKGTPAMSDTVADDHGYFIQMFKALRLEGLYILSELDRI